MKPLPLSVEPEAEADILEAFEWYEKQRPGLGIDFIECVDDIFEHIAENPVLHAECYRTVRQALVKRFPYVVCFVVEPIAISIVAVFHVRRDPRQWQARLR